jgi:hypothetical protein
MLTQREITAYAEEMRCEEEGAVDEYPGQWEQWPVRPCTNPPDVAEWYREYEEETGTLLGCD